MASSVKVWIKGKKILAYIFYKQVKFALCFTPIDIEFAKPNWDNIMTKRDVPAMSRLFIDFRRDYLPVLARRKKIRYNGQRCFSDRKEYITDERF